MTPEELSIQQLTQQNKDLQAKLEAAEQWIGREFSDRKLRLEKEAMLEQTRSELAENSKQIEARIRKYFGDTAPLL